MLYGTVSGGLSAELTGGNFWQGAATGLTVSALNHVAHRIQEFHFITKIEKELQMNGYKIEGSVPLKNRAQYALEMIKNLPSLSKSLRVVLKYKSSIKITNKNKRIYNSNGNEINAITNPNGNIDLYLGVFETNLTLAVGLGHELIHSFHHVSGLYTIWENMGGLAFAHHMSEALAYSWNVNYFYGQSQFDFHINAARQTFTPINY